MGRARKAPGDVVPELQGASEGNAASRDSGKITQRKGLD